MIRKIHLKTAYILLISLCLFTISCKEKETTKETVVKTFVEDVTKVKVAKVRKGTFYKEILNNGKLSASRKAELQFEQDGKVVSIDVSNGQKVYKGQLLAKVDDTAQKFELEKAQQDLNKAMLEMEDKLISAGYTMKDTATMPQNRLNAAHIHSGYNTAVASFHRAQQNLNDTRIVAPFAGIVSNLEAKAFNPSSKYKILCELIDNVNFEVSFSILETEYKQIEKGLPVELTVSAFANDTFPGIVSCVNPSVDEHGMIKVIATIPNPKNKLIEGMNAQVIVKIAVPNQMIIPKSAVVNRQARKVAFTTKNDSVAHWNYISVLHENSTEVAIRSKIKVDAEVIYDGNIELGHLTPIVVK